MSARSCNVVVLAAGLGARFVAEGISVPKPLIEFRGRSLLERSVDVAKEIANGGRVIVVTTPTVAVHADAIAGVSHVVTVSVTQPGPVASAMLALAHLPLDEPAVFMDCDNFYPADQRSWTQELPFGQNFLVVSETASDDMTYRAQFCNIALKPDTFVVSGIREKLPSATSVLGTGVYGFASARIFSLVGRLALDSEGEVPMSQLYKLMRGETRAVIAEAWLPLGTPRQLLEAARHGIEGPTSRE